jgi:hypothetical protein
MGANTHIARTVPPTCKCTTAVDNQLQASLASWLWTITKQHQLLLTTKTPTASCSYDCSCCFSRPSAASSAPANAQS